MLGTSALHGRCRALLDRSHRFRNLPDVTWEVGPGCHLVSGRNGAGKTSLLEAVYLAATARSFRTSQLEDCVRRDRGPAEAAPGTADDPPAEPAESAGFVVRAEVSGPPLAELAVSWGDGRAGPDARRQGRPAGGLPRRAAGGDLDRPRGRDPGRRARAAPAHDRRRPGRGASRAGSASSPATGACSPTSASCCAGASRGLEAWNRLLAESGSALQRARADWVAELANATASASWPPLERGLPPVELRYEPSPRRGPDGAGDLLESLAAVAADELRLGRPCIGPHLDRLSIGGGRPTPASVQDGPDVSRVASAGERKALGLLLTAAQADLLEAAGRAPPTVLVDDVDAELDLGALEAVWRVLARRAARCSRPAAGRRSPTGCGGVVAWGLEGGSSGRGPVRE